MPTLTLASTSPRRRELLELANIPFTIRKQVVDESTISTTNPREKVLRLAVLKATSMDLTSKDEVIIAADTTVSYKQEIFGKPIDQKDAFAMLTTLSGKVHSVYTGVCIRTTDKKVSFVEKTDVEFWQLSSSEINWYIDTKDPFGKAGAYGIQSVGALLVKQIYGDYYTVMGLPISKVVRELSNFSIYPQ